LVGWGHAFGYRVNAAMIKGLTPDECRDFAHERAALTSDPMTAVSGLESGAARPSIIGLCNRPFYAS
jgi:hypothetical protein